MKSTESIRSEEVMTCLLCGTGGFPLYRGLRDRLFDVPGMWNLLRCTHCGLVWLNPRPLPEEMGRVYRTYYTHTLRRNLFAKLPKVIRHAVLAGVFGYEELERSAAWRFFGRLASLAPTLKDMVGLCIMGLKASERGKVVDVGCGNGQFLAEMQDLGWDVLGVEPDAHAARLAQDSFGVPVIVGTLESASLPEGSCDVITMDHVIEHVPHPIDLLKEAYRVLKPGGKLIVLTPNVESLGHRIFGRTWWWLDPPRHLYLFAASTLQACGEASGFSIENLRTTARNARLIWPNITPIHRDKKTSGPGRSLGFLLKRFLFQVLEETMRLVWRAAGEEVLLVAVKARRQPRRSGPCERMDEELLLYNYQG